MMLMPNKFLWVTIVARYQMSTDKLGDHIVHHQCFDYVKGCHRYDNPIVM